jgi:hypothetical protein
MKMSNTKKTELLNIIDKIAAENRMKDFLSDIEGRTREPGDDLVKRTSERVRAAIREFDARENVAVAAESGGALSFVFEKLKDAYIALPRLVLVDTDIGGPVAGRADDGARRSARRRSKPSNFCTWKQDAFQFTLSCRLRNPDPVTLHIDEGPEVEFRELRWIDEDDVQGDPDRPITVKSFPLKRLPDTTRAYEVKMHVVTFQARMGAIYAAKEGARADSADVRLLLPFVV